MKVLAGQLHETVYHAPNNEIDEEKPLKVKSSKTFGTNEVTYISDDIGLHRVHNPSSSHVAVSLHREHYTSPYTLLVTNSFKVYTPPNAADYGYNIFSEATGSASFVCQAHSVTKAK